MDHISERIHTTGDSQINKNIQPHLNILGSKTNSLLIGKISSQFRFPSGIEL